MWLGSKMTKSDKNGSHLAKIGPDMREICSGAEEALAKGIGLCIVYYCVP